MDKKLLKIIILGFSAFIIFIVMVIEDRKKVNKQIVKDKQDIETIYGNIQFKGEVLKIHKIKRWGRVYGIMCIKLDYSNVDSFYRFDKTSCLKIKNGIAALPTSSVSNDEGYDKRVNAILNATYIEVNMDTNKQMCVIDSAGTIFYQDLYFRSSNLKEEDMLLCDDCEENK
jgi:hypothetical protein